MKADHLQDKPVVEIEPTECALFMQAFCEAGMFKELILFETIQAHFLEKIE